jgi:hypothetical protein
MGDRVSVSFVREAEDWQGQMCRSESVVLFSHWGGIGFVEKAEGYARELVEKMKRDPNIVSSPLARLEPETVMVDFIRYVTPSQARVLSDLYLGADSGSGDNSDNGHYCIHLDTTKVWTEKHLWREPQESEE